ncbi:MAG TPA: hypothetical protein VGL64_02300 [Amycolatopsis sp.]
MTKAVIRASGLAAPFASGVLLDGVLLLDGVVPAGAGIGLPPIPLVAAEPVQAVAAASTATSAAGTTIR